MSREVGRTKNFEPRFPGAGALERPRVEVSCGVRDIHIKKDRYLIAKIFLLNDLQVRGIPKSCQNIEGKGVIRKIFRTKELAEEIKPARSKPRYLL
jgi:hypothetical protein